MSEEPTMPDEFEQHPVLSSDGAYVRLAEGYVSMMFYLDRKYPIHGKNESLTFGNTKREMLHEIRVPYEAAKTISYQLVNGLYLYDKYDPQSMRNKGQTMDKAVENVVKGFEEKPALRKTFEQITPIMSALFFRSMTTADEGMQETVQLLVNFMTEHKQDLDAITARYPRKVEPNETRFQ